VGSGLSNYAISYAGGTFSVTKDPTSIVYTGFVEGDYLGTYTASAMVSGSTGLHPQGATVHFSLSQIPPNGELQGCSGTVDASGFASCQMQLIQPAGTYGITASFLGNNNYEASSTSATLSVGVSDTSLVYTGPSLSANGVPLRVSAQFTDTSAGTPISGRPISFVLGAQGCSGVTNASGEASCTIASVSQPLGPASITTSFAGDGFYLAKSTTSSVLVFEYATGGSFVIGSSQAIVHSDVTFWGARWTRVNMPGAPPPFKGFAPQQTRPACGAGFQFALGSVNPPATVPAYMAVIASTSITQSGSTVVGDSPKIVIVRTAAGYTPDPGTPAPERWSRLSVRVGIGGQTRAVIRVLRCDFGKVIENPASTQGDFQGVVMYLLAPIANFFTATDDPKWKAIPPIVFVKRKMQVEGRPIRPAKPPLTRIKNFRTTRGAAPATSRP
jgi:hypothetical protein